MHVGTQVAQNFINSIELKLDTLLCQYNILKSRLRTQDGEFSQIKNARTIRIAYFLAQRIHLMS